MLDKPRILSLFLGSFNNFNHGRSFINQILDLTDELQLICLQFKVVMADTCI